MRHWLAVASSVAILLGSAPVLARTMTHQSGGAVVHNHAAIGNRFVVVSHAGFGNHVVVFDRFFQRFAVLSPHGFHHFGHGFHNVDGANGWGGGWWGGWDGWGDGWSGGWSGGPVVASAEPLDGERGALPPRPPQPPAALPPCHETTPVGVVIERGGGCAH